MAPKARPPGTGRKARAKRRREELAAGGQLLSAVAYHGHTAPARLRLLNLFLRLSLAPELFGAPEGTDDDRGAGDERDCDGRITTTDDNTSTHDNASCCSNGAVGTITPVVMDIGFGDEPTTTVELQGLLSADVQIVATEADRERLDRAEASQRNDEVANHRNATPSTKKPIRFCQTGTDFSLPPLQEGEVLRLVIAMNVLRDYHAWDAAAALSRMWSQMPPGSCMVEGSCDITGSRLVAVILKGGEPLLSGFVFAADVSGSREDASSRLCGSPPSWFDWYLPRVWLKGGEDGGLDSLRSTTTTTTTTTEGCSASCHHAEPTNAVRGFLGAWEEAAEACKGAEGEDHPAEWLRASAAKLREADPRVDVSLAQHGVVIWWAKEALPSYHPKHQRQQQP